MGVAACLGWDLVKRISIRHNRGIAKGKRFVILGGGFAGVEASRDSSGCCRNPITAKSYWSTKTNFSSLRRC